MNQCQGQNSPHSFDAQVCRAITRLLLEHLSLEFRSRVLTRARAFEILCYAAVQQTTIETACRHLAQTPSANTVRECLAQALETDPAALARLEERLNQTLHDQLPRAVKRRLQTRAWEVAGDWVSLPYYGHADEDDPNVRRSKPERGTSRFFSYATLSLCYKHRRVTVALTIVKAGEKVVEVVKRLINIACRLRLKIKRSYWDKAFGSMAVMRYLRSRRTAYIIALAARGKKGIKTLFAGRASYQTRYRFRNATDNYATDVVVACKYSRARYKKKGVRYWAYAVYALGGVKPLRVAKLYRRRFSIETGYRQLHQVRAWTTSRNPALRLLLVGIGILLVNCCLLCRRSWGIQRQHGTRQRTVALTLFDLAMGICRYLEHVLGVTQVSPRQRGPNALLSFS